MSLESSEKAICRLCGRQVAKYNCPTCNVPYCSLSCFRSEAHSTCSETFYKKEIETGIRAEPSKSAQERKQMMEMLKRFEEQSLEDDEDDEDADDEDADDEDADDLAQRFQGVDLDSASANELWEKLTPEEQQEFLKLMQDPDSDLAKQLLASEALLDESFLPWWEAPTEPEAAVTAKKYGKRPESIYIPSSLVKPLPMGSPLIYNMAAICIAYAYTTRRLSVSPLGSQHPDSVDVLEAQDLITQLLPFLVERKSSTLFTNFSSLSTDLWSRLPEVEPRLFALLLRDTVQVLRPLPVTAVSTIRPGNAEAVDIMSHPHLNSVLVLSDVAKLFELGASGRQNKSKHVVQKLVFYAAQILSTPSPILRVLADEMALEAARYERGAETSSVVAEEARPRITTQEHPKKIEEVQ